MPNSDFSIDGRVSPGVPSPVTYSTSKEPHQPVLPSREVLDRARTGLVAALPRDGIGYERTTKHILDHIAPALNGSSNSPNYYGFVTGGVTPAAALADNIVTAYDQNVQVHLPNETVTTDVEDQALKLLSSNVVGLACAREHVILSAAARNGHSISVAELGLAGAMRAAGVDDIQILTTVPHSSLGKAASIVGLGRASLKAVGLPDAPHRFDPAKLEAALALDRTGSIVAISCSEVNTGRFATSAYADMAAIRELCDKYGSWIHVDAAFGLLGRALNKSEFPKITAATEGMELADSITGDGHKLLNVPYDCGFFLSRHLRIGQNTFQNANAAYLNANAGRGAASIPSPLNIGIENSRRFRALPVYATLVAYGKQGYRAMLERQIRLARAIARFIMDHEAYELLPQSDLACDHILEEIYIIVLFRAKNEKLNSELVSRINATSRIYVSGTSWEGTPACRFAVSNWQVDFDRDLQIICEVLDVVSRAPTEAWVRKVA
ncbi:Pyridoxal phosphate-dependent decarboxylase [Macrophomina phaseolina MS6]|uniref:Pyridoxal phosphate-dependent decarboxylase n=1 Tax=Macrophomina phaseolina (strain MS6) TaxID=1126212 RepID=K2RCN5_MACPH|nr:Pyridoxal phosphate-dependent decarboxylase [Macrophomina phaseolina MS6]